MKKLFVCSDIHGFYDEWIKALNQSGFDINNSDHILVVCGDLLDRGKQANQCLKFVNDLPDDRKILITGNHELLMDDILYVRYHFASHDYSNGTVNTIEQLTGIIEQYDGRNSSWAIQQTMIDEMRRHEGWLKYYKSTTMCAEIGPYIFVHGWIPVDVYVRNTYLGYEELYSLPENWREAEYHQWKDATWLNGMFQWKEGIEESGKTIVCGHFHTSWGHSRLYGVGTEWGEDAHFEPFEGEGILAMDACTAHSGQINVKVLEVSDKDYENRKRYF